MLIPSSPVVHRKGHDEGIALPTVLISMLVLTALALAALAFVVQSTPANRTTADDKAALAAAQAGVDEYTTRLNGKPTYYTSVDASNRAFTRKADGTTFADGRDARGVLVPGTSDAYYRYEVLTKPATTARSNIIRLRVTGTASGKSRSLTASYDQGGYLKFLYFTDVEALDPALLAPTQSAAVRDAYIHHCSQRWYDDGGQAGRSRNTFDYLDTKYTVGTGAGQVGACTEIQFSGSDVIQGPLHTNDALLLGGNVVFKDDTVQTAWGPTKLPAPTVALKPWRGAGVPQNTDPVTRGEVEIPKTNVKLRGQSQVPGIGCEYSGETSLEFDGDAVIVLSPGTKSSTSPSCFNTANPSKKQRISPVPEVIYVRNTTTCGSVRLGYLEKDRGSEITGVQALSTVNDCKAGNAFVSGSLDGQVTVGSENDAIITGDITYAGGSAGDDVLGLIPQNYAWVYHPVEPDGSTYGRDVGGKQVQRIDAAILSLNRSFLVQNWNAGTRSSAKLTVNGVIAQRFRGPVATTANTGYQKNYVYDERLKNLPPPYFLIPEKAPWTVKRLTDG